MALVVLAGVAPPLRQLVRETLSEEGVAEVEEEPDAEAALQRVDEIDLLVLGESIPDPVRAAEQVGARATGAAVMIIVAPGRASETKRSLRFSPLLSGDVRLVAADNPDEIARQARSLVTKAQRRSRFRSVLPRLQEKLPVRTAVEQRAVYLDALLNYAPLGVLVMDSERTAIDLNPAAERFLSDSASEVVGRPFLELLPELVREEADRLVRRAATAETGSATVRAKWAPADADLHVEMLAVPFSKGVKSGTMLILRDVTADVHVEQAEWELREQRAVSQALEEQADELRRLNNELAARNEELQQFAYVASHDLQEPLRKIASFTDLLFAEAADELDAEARFYLERVQAAALRMSDLIRSLLRFSRAGTQALEQRPVDLNEIFRHIQSDLVIQIEESDAAIRIGELPVIEGDEGQIRQLFQNLIANAIKFHKPNERPTIRVSSEEDDLDGRRMHRITVSDEGIGFDEQYAERIFAPFQRLHPREEYAGTGMGLAICNRIAERHGGSITARSRPGEGSTFVVALPAVSE